MAIVVPFAAAVKTFSQRLASRLDFPPLVSIPCRRRSQTEIAQRTVRVMDL
jgi:hypothetical protein